MRSCYIHIPFCQKICSYCDFCKMFYYEKLADQYLDALEKEIQKQYQGDVLSTIYIGGGTPSCLTLAQWKRLFRCFECFTVASDLEFTVEVNLDSIDCMKLDLFRMHGVNRLSIGIESVVEKNQELMERYISKDEIRQKLSLIRSKGFSNINLDLMYAFPEETISSLSSDLDFVLSLHPEHISTYSLMIEEHTKLGIAHCKPISEDLDASMYQLICTRLEQEGYIHYEISNFGKRGYFSRHNLCYWENREYYGFGLGASFFLDSERGLNTRSIGAYCGGDYLLSSEEVSFKDDIEYEIILNLRLWKGLDKKKFYQKYYANIDDFYDYQKLIQQGFLVDDGKSLFIPEKKWYISNSILLKIIEGEK